MPGRNNKILTVGGKSNPFQGVMLNVSEKDLPPYVFQKLINLEPARKIGSLKKRDRYEELLSGQGSFENIKEFLDKNDGRQIMGLKSSDIYEAVHNGTSYGNFTQITSQSNDMRYSQNAFSFMNPVILDNVFRTGAGINVGNSLPAWYGYIAEQLRFPIGETRYGETYYHEMTINAGKYLCDQILYRDTLEGYIFISSETVQGYRTGGGLNAGFDATEDKYIYVYVVPVFDGYQTGFIRNKYYGTGYGRSVYVTKIPYHASEMYSLKLTIKFKHEMVQKNPRLTHLDVFVSTLQDANIYKPSDEYATKLFPAYFLERIPLTSDPDTILNMAGTFQIASPPTYITFADDFANWESFLLTGCYAQIANGISFKLGARSTSSTQVRYAVTGAITAYSGQTHDFEIKSKWHETTAASPWQEVQAYYDDHHRKLGSYYFEYAGIPEGDTGLTDPRYKYACEAGRRYFIFGRDDGFGYFSLANKPDVIPSLNIIRPKFKETGCISIDKDVLLFGKFRTARIQVLSNENAQQDDEFLNVGCVGQNSIVKLDEYNIAWMSYKGPYLLLGRETKPIGEVLSEWWEEIFDESDMETCVAGYNHKKDQIWFSFPNYSDDYYTNGIIFVFDLKAYRNQFITSWYYFTSNVAIESMDLNEDGHLISLCHVLGPGNDKVVDWNSVSPSESCTWLLKMGLLENELMGKRLRNNFKKLFIDYETSDTVTARVYLDGDATPTNLTLNSNKEAFLRYLRETMEIEILAGSSANEAEIKKIQVMFTEKNF